MTSALSVSTINIVLAIPAMLCFYRGIFKIRERKLLAFVGVIVSILAYVFLSLYLDSYIVSGLAIKITLCLIALLLFEVDVLQAIYIGVMVDVVYYSIRGVFIGSVAAATYTRISLVLESPTTLIAINTLTLGLILCGLILFPKKVKYGSFKRFLEDKNMLISFLIFLGIMAIFIDLINNGRFLEYSSRWFASVFLLSAVMCVLVLGLIQFYVLRVHVLIDEKAEDIVKVRTLEYQVDHLESLQNSNESLRKFKHDFVAMLETIHYYNDAKDMSGLDAYLHSLNEFMDAARDATEKQSNNPLVDAMLYNAKQKADRHGIAFEAAVFLPNEVQISDYSLVRIFSNCLNNAFEASIKDEQGSITVYSLVKENWFQVQFMNSFHSVVLENNIIRTSKSDTIQHGFGLSIIQDEVHKSGGIYSHVIDEEHHVFTTTISIPIKISDKT